MQWIGGRRYDSEARPDMPAANRPRSRFPRAESSPHHQDRADALSMAFATVAAYSLDASTAAL